MRGRVLLIAVVTLGCYAHLLFSTSSEFVFDDRRFVSENEAVGDLSRFFDYFTDPSTVDPNAWNGIYRPIRTADFALDWAIAGMRPWWYHWRSVIYHLLGAILVMVLLGQWGAGKNAATLGALVFAAHPVQVESAGWITSRGDVVCLVFFLLALILHNRSRGLDRAFLGAAGALVLALLSKEVAVMFPAAVALSDFFFRDEHRLKKTLRRWPQYLVYAVLAGLYVWLWRWMHTDRQMPLWHIDVRWGDSFLGTLLTMSRGFVYYLRLIVLPVDMATDFYVMPVRTLDPLTMLCSAIVLGLLGYSVFRAFRGGGALAFAVLWAFITIFPASNLPAPIGIVTAERFLYLPMVGIALAAGLWLGRAWAAGRLGRVCAVAVVVCLAAASFDRASDWESENTLWLGTLKRFPSPRALDWRGENLREQGADLRLRARSLREKGDTEAAEQCEARAQELLDESIRIFGRAMRFWEPMPVPGAMIAGIRARRAHSYFEQGKIDVALEEAEEILDFWKGQGRANLVKALALHAKGELRAAGIYAENALEIEKGVFWRRRAAAIYQDLAKWYNERGLRARTYAALTHADELYPTPEFTESLQAMRDQFDELEPVLRREIARGNAVGEDWLNLAKLLAQYGNYPESGRIFQRLLDQAEEGPGIRESILMHYARYQWEERDSLEGYDQAKELYEKVKSLSPDFPGVKEALERVDRERAALEKSLKL